MPDAALVLCAGAAVTYTVATVAHLAYLFRTEWVRLARWSTRLAVALHTMALLALVAGTGRPPVFTPFESVLGVTWLLSFAYLLAEVVTDNQTAGAFLVPVVFILVTLAGALPKPGYAEPALFGLPAGLVFWHVAVILLSYLFFVFASVAGAMYLVLDHLLRTKSFPPVSYRLPSLEALDLWGYRFIATGFPLLSLGLLFGLFFAAGAWAGRWYLEPKVVWTAGTWLVYAGYLAVRRLSGWGGRRAAWWSIAGFLAILINYYVISTFLTDLHRFGV